MKNQFIFNNNLRRKTESEAVVNSINKIIRHRTPGYLIPYIELKTILENFDNSVVLNNAYRGKEYGENDFDLHIINETTTINVYCGLSIYVYRFHIGDKHDKSGFYYIEEKTIEPISSDEQCNVAETPEAKVTEVKKPVEPSKPEPEIDMVTRLSKMRDYFAMNKIFTDNFDNFIDDSIGSLTNNLINIRDTFNSFPDPFINLTSEEIEKYIRPFDNIIALIDIENPDKAAYMIKSAFNALLIAHMDARLNNEDEDFHIEYNVNSK